MVSHRCKGKESVTSRFFKIILLQTLEEQKLMIPIKFVRNHGVNLHNQTTLKAPDDSTWIIELEKCNGRVWMGKGWKEFADHYSLAVGHFLVFEYRGNSDFSVFIFDNTATEMDYPLSNRRNADHELPHQDVEGSDFEDDDDDDESIEILESCTFSRKKTERPPLPSHNPRKITKTDPTNKASGGANCGPSMNQMERGKSYVGKFVKGSSSSGVPASKPYPFFEVEIPKSCLVPHVLPVPISFIKTYIKREKQEMELQVGDSSWLVTLKYYPKRFYSRLSAGWMEFARENNLEKGDTCTFELIKRNVLRVSISRKT